MLKILYPNQARTIPPDFVAQGTYDGDNCNQLVAVAIRNDNGTVKFGKLMRLSRTDWAFEFHLPIATTWRLWVFDPDRSDFDSAYFAVEDPGDVSVSYPMDNEQILNRTFSAFGNSSANITSVKMTDANGNVTNGSVTSQPTSQSEFWSADFSINGSINNDYEFEVNNNDGHSKESSDISLNII